MLRDRVLVWRMRCGMRGDKGAKGCVVDYRACSSRQLAGKLRKRKNVARWPL